MTQDYKLASYNYHLPENQIAQEPASKRDQSRLFLMDREKGNSLHSFSDLVDLLPDNCLLVANNSRVLPARLEGKKRTGGKVEFLLLTPLPLLQIIADENGWNTANAKGLLRASKGPRPGDKITFAGNLSLTVQEKGAYGQSRVELKWKGDLRNLFNEIGHVPLPPYIRRDDRPGDRDRYQTVYARTDRAGSVAAPTAGLHFTPEIHEKLAAKGMEWKEVTLYVGYGTFSPVRAEDIRDHQMHAEYVEVSENTALAIRKAKDEGRPVVAVGTTSAHSLEGMFLECGKISEFSGLTDIFIKPGYTFKVIDHMLTNFHLPESSLIIMISALAGRKKVLEAYAEALSNGFRFFSYGDAMLIL